ncbi:hypothetical protein [Paenibacillus antarcticus]|nr:hypothetical protein [Paenibacillus antarcticus]
MNLGDVMEICKTYDIDDVNDMLGTGKWKIAHELFDGLGNIEFILYRTKR